MDSRLTAPYATFSTFLGLLDIYKETGIPQIINQETFANFSRHDKWQLLGAFIFLDLVDEYGKPTQKLEHLVIQEIPRPTILKRILELSYTPFFENGIENLTRDALNQTLSERYGVRGDTQKKARTFFIKACEFAGVVLPLEITKRRRQSRARKVVETVSDAPTFFEQPDERTEENTQKEVMPEELIQNNERGDGQPSFVNTINLKSGGKLTLSAEVDVWKLDREDRNLVFKIVDDMKDYEKIERP